MTIEEVPGELTDHYDSRAKVLRLSPEVYERRSLASVGIAAHEAGHALQDSRNYTPLVVRNAAVPIANLGSNAGIGLIFLGFLFHMHALIVVGIVLFAGVVFFQVVNLPVEFDASNRAKAQLVQLGIIDDQQLAHVRSVLNAAAWTYVAGTLQAVMILLYYIMRFGGGSSRN